MSNTRGGRRIKIQIVEYAYPHSKSAKENGVGQAYTIYTSGDNGKHFQRPTKAVEDFVFWCFDHDLLVDKNFIYPMFKYLSLGMDRTKARRLGNEKKDSVV
jgi:hypothetical protein